MRSDRPACCPCSARCHSSEEILSGSVRWSTALFPSVVAHPVTKSDGQDRYSPRERLGNLPQIPLIGSQDAETTVVRHEHNMDIDHIRRGRPRRDGPDLMRVGFCECDDIASPQETPKLRLASRAADLSDHWCRRDRNHTELEPNPMISPYPTVGPISRDQRPGVVEDGHARRRLPEATGRSCAAIRSRAAASSASLSAPCSASHSLTAARPSRTSSARRAALVIHADTLTPSSAAAAMSLSCTSGSTVIASFGDGFPLGMPEVYYRGRSVGSAAWRRPDGHALTARPTGVPRRPARADHHRDLAAADRYEHEASRRGAAFVPDVGTDVSQGSRVAVHSAEVCGRARRSWIRQRNGWGRGRLSEPFANIKHPRQCADTVCRRQ